MKGTFGPEKLAVRRDIHTREKSLRIPIIVAIALICLCLAGFLLTKYKKYAAQAPVVVSTSYSQKIKNWFAAREKPNFTVRPIAKKMVRNRPPQVHFEFYKSLTQMDVKRVLKEMPTAESSPAQTSPQTTIVIKSVPKAKPIVPLALFADAKALEQDLNEQLNKKNKTR